MGMLLSKSSLSQIGLPESN